MEHNSNYGTRWRSTMEIIARQQRQTSVVALQICSLVAVANHCQQYYRTTEIFGGDRRRGNEQMDQTKCSLAAAISTVLLNEN